MKIDHLKVRHNDDHFYLNLIFSFDTKDEWESINKEIFHLLAEEYSRVSVMDSKEDYEKYHEGLSIDFEQPIEGRHDDARLVVLKSSYSKAPVQKWKYEPPIFEYIPKFDKYRFCETIRKNELTLTGLRILLDQQQITDYNTGSDMLRSIIHMFRFFLY